MERRKTTNISQTQLENLYIKEQKSAKQIAKLFSCSENKINYWLRMYGIKKRTIAESLYISHNPGGDPFAFKEPKTPNESFLYGLGLGLYWGEGNKKNTHSIRLGNTDPRLVKAFTRFLTEVYAVKKEKFRFGLQIFSDMSPEKALRFWSSYLSVSSKQFGKVIVTPARGVGSYREKTKYGVLTVYVSNKKLRDIICGEIEKL